MPPLWPMAIPVVKVSPVPRIFIASPVHVRSTIIPTTATNAKRTMIIKDKIKAAACALSSTPYLMPHLLNRNTLPSACSPVKSGDRLVAWSATSGPATGGTISGSCGFCSLGFEYVSDEVVRDSWFSIKRSVLFAHNIPRLTRRVCCVGKLHPSQTFVG